MQAAHREHACGVAGKLGRWMRNVMQGGCLVDLMVWVMV